MRQIYQTVSNQKTTTTVNTLTETECAYIAGMIDADGSICKCKNKEYFVLKVRIHNSDKELMDWLKNIIGGGNVHYLPPAIDKQGYKHTKIRWTYDVSAKVDVMRLLEQIEPYLIIKKKKAQEVMWRIPLMKRPSKYKKRRKGGEKHDK